MFLSIALSNAPILFRKALTEALFFLVLASAIIDSAYLLTRLIDYTLNTIRASLD